MTELLSFLKNPVYAQNKKPNSKEFISLLMIYFLTILPLGFIIYAFCKFFNITHKEIILTPWMKLLVGVILAPIYEEFIFRSLLKFKKINILLFITTLFGFIFYSISKSRTEVTTFLSIFVLSFLCLLIFTSRTQIESYISSRFKYFFYASILLFGLLHATNFTGNLYAIIAFSLILGSPQLVLGAILGYIRMNYGLVYSILFHMIVNTSIVFSLLGS